MRRTFPEQVAGGHGANPCPSWAPDWDGAQGLHSQGSRWGWFTRCSPVATLGLRPAYTRPLPDLDVDE